MSGLSMPMPNALVDTMHFQRFSISPASMFLRLSTSNPALYSTVSMPLTLSQLE